MAKQKTLGQLKQDVQKIFNKNIRERDKEQMCISCGRPGNQAGHYHNVKQYDSLRYDPDNCHLQCAHCNMWLHGNLIEYRKGLIERIGEDRVLDLEDKAAEYKRTGHKWTRQELQEIKDHYKKLTFS